MDNEMDVMEISESTLTKIHIGKGVCRIIAELGSTQIINHVAKSIANQEPNKFRKILIRIGGYALVCAVTRGIDGTLDDIEESVILAIRTAKACKVFKEEMEKNNGTEPEQSESTEE